MSLFVVVCHVCHLPGTCSTIISRDEMSSLSSCLPLRVGSHLQAEADNVGDMGDDDGHLALDEFVKHFHCLAGVVLCKQGDWREGVEDHFTRKLPFQCDVDAKFSNVDSALTSSALMRCLRATIRLGMRARIWFCCRSNEDSALKRVFELAARCILVLCKQVRAQLRRRGLPAPPSQCTQ